MCTIEQVWHYLCAAVHGANSRGSAHFGNVSNTHAE